MGFLGTQMLLYDISQHFPESVLWTLKATRCSERKGWDWVPPECLGAREQMEGSQKARI